MKSSIVSGAGCSSPSKLIDSGPFKFPDQKPKNQHSVFNLRMKVHPTSFDPEIKTPRLSIPMPGYGVSNQTSKEGMSVKATPTSRASRATPQSQRNRTPRSVARRTPGIRPEAKVSFISKLFNLVSYRLDIIEYVKRKLEECSLWRGDRFQCHKTRGATSCTSKHRRYLTPTDHPATYYER